MDTATVTEGAWLSEGSILDVKVILLTIVRGFLVQFTELVLSKSPSYNSTDTLNELISQC